MKGADRRVRAGIESQKAGQLLDPRPQGRFAFEHQLVQPVEPGSITTQNRDSHYRV